MNRKVLVVAIILAFAYSMVVACTPVAPENDAALGGSPYWSWQFPDAIVGVKYKASLEDDAGNLVNWSGNVPGTDLTGKPSWLQFEIVGISGIGFSLKRLQAFGTPTEAGTFCMEFTHGIRHCHIWITVKPSPDLSYNANGGSGSMAPTNNTSVVADNSFMPPANHIFAGWNTAANGTGQWVSVGSKYIIIKPTTLYAQWSFVSPPIAAFVSSTNNLTATFTNTSVLADTYLWEFGDGSTSTQKNPVRTYAAGGTYSVKLTVTGVGGTNNITRSVTVASGIMSAPVPSFLSSIEERDVQFTYTGTPATSFLWNFGDGSTSTEADPMHTYVAGGTYTVTLKATNAAGTNTAAGQVMIAAPPEPPEEPSRGIIDWIVENPWLAVMILLIILIILLAILVIL